MTFLYFFLWMFLSLGIVSLFGRRLAEHDIPLLILFFFWPIVVPVLWIGLAIIWVLGYVTDFLEHIAR